VNTRDNATPRSCMTNILARFIFLRKKTHLDNAQNTMHDTLTTERSGISHYIHQKLKTAKKKLKSFHLPKFYRLLMVEGKFWSGQRKKSLTLL
jgi:hypothetical protein